MTVSDHFLGLRPGDGAMRTPKPKTFLRGKTWTKTIGRVRLPLVGGGH
jgi:hypothetical protein